MAAIWAKRYITFMSAKVSDTCTSEIYDISTSKKIYDTCVTEEIYDISVP